MPWYIKVYCTQCAQELGPFDSEAKAKIAAEKIGNGTAPYWVTNPIGWERPTPHPFLVPAFLIRFISLYQR